MTAVPGAPVVRRVSAEDPLEPVGELAARTFTNPWTTESIRWELTHTAVSRLFSIADDIGLIGYCLCWVVAGELHINSLAIDPARRGAGHGARLLAAVMSAAAAEGATAATLEVRRSNRAALALYERAGFRVEAVRVDYYEQPREDALVLWHRALPPARPA